MKQYSIERKRAAVDVFQHSKKLKKEHGAKWLSPIELASIASGGASETQIYTWTKEDLSEAAVNSKKETRGRERMLTPDQTYLLIGFGISVRQNFIALTLEKMRDFCHSHLHVTPSDSTLSRIMTEFGFSSQKTLTRCSRLVTEDVVEDAIEAIAEVRSYGFPPERIIAMDETGLWSNVTEPKTYHFTNWYDRLHSFGSDFFSGIPFFLEFPKKVLHPHYRTLSNFSIPFRLLYERSNAVVKETGDSFRDTVALTVRGDGVDIPPFIILHTYKNAAKKSGRKCEVGNQPVKGMNNERMKAYIDHISEYVKYPSLLLMDRLSSHKAGQVRLYIEKKKTADGQQKFIPIYLPPKTAFLISPLDMGAIGAFKSHFYKLDRSDLPKKLRAVQVAWDAVTNSSLVNIYQNCGLIGDETLSSIRTRFRKEIGSLVPEELEEHLNYYESWNSGKINVPGADNQRGVELINPFQIEEGYLDGKHWTKFGGK